jgi:hypothetical protein
MRDAGEANLQRVQSRLLNARVVEQINEADCSVRDLIFQVHLRAQSQAMDGQAAVKSASTAPPE